MMLRSALLLILTLSSVGPLMADVIRVPYQFVEEGWRSESRETSCELSQDLPLFGTARFLRSTRDTVSLVIDSMVPVDKPGVGRLYSVQPSWKGGGEEEDITKLDIGVGPRPIVLSRTQALQVFYALYQGRAVNLEFNDLATGTSQIQLQLSPIDFLTQVQAFEVCIGRLTQEAMLVPEIAAAAMVDERRIQAVEAPRAPRSGLQLKPLVGDDPSLSYQFDADGKPAPVRIRMP